MQRIPTRTTCVMHAAMAVIPSALSRSVVIVTATNIRRTSALPKNLSTRIIFPAKRGCSKMKNALNAVAADGFKGTAAKIHAVVWIPNCSTPGTYVHPATRRENRMPFPKTEAEFAEAGYEYESTSRCKGPTCRASIAWYRTPKGKRIPLDEGTLEPHWSTCPDAIDFRKPQR